MFGGTIVALATPFNEQDQVDYCTLRELIEWHIASGTDGIVLCGTTGEAPTLCDEEQMTIFKEGVIDSKGRIPIIAGTGTYHTHHCVEKTRLAKKAGVDGALIIVPYYNRPTPEGCFQHFQAISKVDLPMIVYHHPGRTGVKLAVKDLLRIAEIPNIAAIKESTGDLDYAIELIHHTSVPVMTGDDGLVLPFMAVGGAGVISVVANIIPGEWKQLTTLLANDQFKEARDLFNRFFPLVKSMFLETNPQCIKYAMGTLGKCFSKMRLPMIEPQESSKQRIVNELIKAGLLHRSNASSY